MNHIDCVDCFFITRLVMACAEVSAPHPDAVASIDKGFHDQNRVDPTGTHDPHYPHVGWILKPGNARQITAGIRTPVAQYAEKFWFKTHSITSSKSRRGVLPTPALLLIHCVRINLRKNLIGGKTPHGNCSPGTLGRADTTAFAGSRNGNGARSFVGFLYLYGAVGAEIFADAAAEAGCRIN